MWTPTSTEEARVLCKSIGQSYTGMVCTSECVILTKRASDVHVIATASNCNIMTSLITETAPNITALLQCATAGEVSFLTVTNRPATAHASILRVAALSSEITDGALADIVFRSSTECTSEVYWSSTQTRIIVATSKRLSIYNN